MVLLFLVMVLSIFLFAPNTPVLVLALFGHNSVLRLQFQLIAQWFPLLSFYEFADTFAVPVQEQMPLVHAILFVVCLGFVVWHML